MSDAVEELVALSLLQSGFDTRAARLFNELKREGEPLRQVFAAALGIPPAAVGSEMARARERAREAMADARRQGLTVLTCSAAAYPAMLRQIPDPPIVLWIKGDPATLLAPTVAVVGARNATPAGLAMANRLGRELAEAGVTVASGLARGVDGAAHLGAIEAGGRTIAVLGCGADVVYPREHAGLSQRVLDAGAIVSELRPGAPPLPHHFPLRNRIVSGLSRAVVVIEASEKSGSLITAKAALEQGRDVLAVPGNVLSGRYRGSHALIKDGARLVETVEDVLDEIGWLRPRGAAAVDPLQLSALEETMTPGEPYSVDDLAARTGRGTADLLAELGALEVAGRIARIAGGTFVRT